MDLDLDKRFALQMDKEDPLADYKDRFYQIPGKIYMDGNSLGLLSKDSEKSLLRLLEEWKNLAIGGWTEGKIPWITYAEKLGAMESKIVGAEPDEVVVCGGTTINLTGTISPVFNTSAGNILRTMDLTDTISAVFDVSGTNILRTMNLTGGADSVFDVSGVKITIIFTLPSAGGGLAWGEETPTQSEVASPWNNWSDGAGGLPTITGDQRWGVLSIDTPDEGRSAVYDFGSSTSRTYTLTLNRYGTGSGTPVVQIRGQNTSFNQDDASPSWETYSTPVAKTWRYVQVRIDYS